MYCLSVFMIFELRAKGDVIVLMLCADCSLFCKMMSSYDIIKYRDITTIFLHHLKIQRKLSLFIKIGMDDVNKYEIACRCPAADASLFRVFNKLN